MQIEPIKLKIGDDDWEMDFFESITRSNFSVRITYKSLYYTFCFPDFDHLKRDCKKLANYQLSCDEVLPFGHERIYLPPSGLSLAIITPTDAMQNILLPLPVWFQCELSKRFFEPEKPKMPELEVGDIVMWFNEGGVKRTTQRLNNGAFFELTTLELLPAQFIYGYSIYSIYRFGVKIWEAGE
jgi:hypothetical protein